MKSIESFKQSRGAVAPLVAIMLILIVVCVALVVDLGHIHNVKVQLQRAADAAALAGAQELSGASGAAMNARNVAFATAQANTVDQDPVFDDPTDIDVVVNPDFKGQSIVAVQPIRWDPNIVDEDGNTQTTNDRITPLPVAQYDTANGVWVTAQRDVDHVFFFFTGSTPVTADAIAVNIYEEQTIPIALVSCIPTGGSSVNIHSPGLSICDIVTYQFNADTEDTAAWTSLTFGPASNPNIMQFLDEDGAETFNQVVYGGTGPSRDGIENTDVIGPATRIIPVPDFPGYDPDTTGCLGNDGLTITCGLGEDPSLDPEDPDLIRRLDPAKVPGAAITDPLAYDPLPRWYHFDDDATTYDVYNDAFTRLVTQNGTLVQNVGENETVYQTRLQNLYTGALPSPYGGTGDARFKKQTPTGPGEKFIKWDASEAKYKPDFNEVLSYAGYPPVWVNNGVIPPALAQFLNDLIDTGTDEFKTSVSGEFEPFNTGNEANSGGSGETVQLTMPVIFAGPCDEWRALATGPPTNGINLYYVGTANFLLTRAWRPGNNCYDHGSRAISVEFNPPNDCSPAVEKTFDPAIAGSDIQCAGGSTPNAALEGLIRVPTEGDEAAAGIRKIYLVE
jgi:Flp pilus assembly protein TadG